MKHLTMILLAGVSLSGCATASFAPPSVRVNYVGEAVTEPCPSSRARRPGRTVLVSRDVEGALRVVDAYIDAYTCSEHDAANGRQFFEVPSFLIATATVAAAAFGASPDVAIAGGAANAVLSGGKAYYDPKLKASIYAHSLDALRCISSEAVGIDNFAVFKAESDTTTQRLNALGIAGKAANTTLVEAIRAQISTVSVTNAQQYFVMVTKAAQAVSDILTDRLSSVGTFNAASSAAELEKLLEDIRKKEEEKKKAKDTPAPGTTTTNAKGIMMVHPPTERALAERRQQLIDIDLKLLHPKLQACIWRAKV